jgi:hypothetical protein
MAIKTTRWRPDTCDCIVEYTWDDSLPLDQVTHTLDTVTRKCTYHENIPSDSEVWNCVKEENPRKNIAHQLLLDNSPSTVFDLDTDGNRIFKKGISVNWTWTGTAPNRLLTIVVTGIVLTTNQKNAIQAKLNERFGINNVTFENQA